jgi:hypothetical protein
MQVNNFAWWRSEGTEGRREGGGHADRSREESDGEAKDTGRLNSAAMMAAGM